MTIAKIKRKKWEEIRDSILHDKIDLENMLTAEELEQMHSVLFQAHLNSKMRSNPCETLFSVADELGLTSELSPYMARMAFSRKHLLDLGLLQDLSGK